MGIVSFVPARIRGNRPCCAGAVLFQSKNRGLPHNGAVHFMPKMRQALSDECDKNAGRKACLEGQTLRTLYVLYSKLPQGRNRVQGHHRG